MPNFDYLLGGQVAQVDPMRIALQGATLADIATQAKLRQRLLQMQNDQDESQAVYQQAMPELYRGGQLTQDNFARVMQDPRFGKALPLLEGFADKTMKAQAELRKSEAEVLDKKSQSTERSWKVLGGMAAEVADNPTPQNLQRLSAQAKYMNIELPLPPSPFGSVEDLKGYASLLAAGATDPKSRAEIWKLKTMTPLEAEKVRAETGKITTDTGLAPFIANTGRISANASASNAQTNRLQYTNPNLQHVSDPNSGQLYTFNPKGGAFGAAADASGVPLPKTEKPLTESQGNATAYGMRMKYSNDIINGLEQSGFDLSSLPNRYLPESVIGNNIADPKAQQAYQAKLNFMTASLRKESGAVISPSEFESEEKKYFPQPGDSPQMMAQKAQARALALNAMSIQAGPGSSKVNATQGGGGYASGKIVSELPDPATLAPGTRVRDTKTGKVMVAGPNGYTMEK